MNYANVDFLLDVLTLVVPLALGVGAAMVGSFLLFTLPAWLKRRAHRLATRRAALLPTALPSRADDLDRSESEPDAREERKDRWTA